MMRVLAAVVLVFTMPSSQVGWTCIGLCDGGVQIRTGVVWAQEAKAAPTLTEAQIDKLRVHIQRVEIAQLKFQLVKAEFEQAQREAQALAASLKVDGYTLDLDRLVYVPAPKPKPVLTPPAPASQETPK